MIPSSSPDMTSVLMQGGVFGGASVTENNNSPGNYFDPRSLSGLQTMSYSDDPAVKRAALQEIGGQFEAILVKQMMDSMRNTTNAMFEDSLFNPQSVQFYQSMLDDQMSIELTGENGIGLAEQFVANLSDRYGLEFEESQLPKGDPEFFQTLPVVATTTHQNSPSQNRGPQNRSQALAVDSPIDAVSSQISINDSVLDASRELSRAARAFMKGSEPDDKADFVLGLLPLAQKAGRDLGVNPIDIVAQAALETGWGKRIIRDEKGENSFNLFGIKADSRWHGTSVKVSTTEFFDNQPVRVEASFRRYSSYQQSFNDFVHFLKNGERYQSALEHAGGDFYRHLQAAGYATDPRYASKINALSEQIQSDMLLPEKAEQKLSQRIDLRMQSTQQAQVVEKMAENLISGDSW